MRSVDIQSSVQSQTRAERINQIFGCGKILNSQKHPANKGLELTQNQRSARGKEMWRAIIILPIESVSGSSSSLRRYMDKQGNH